jgi:hypothetical protein
MTAVPAWPGEGDQANANFAVSVASAGDVNRDGCGDVIVGADLYDNAGQNDKGRAYLYRGGPSGLETNPIWIAEPAAAGARFGGSVASAGDLGNDGYGDVIVGATGYSNGQSAEGAAFLYRGNATGLQTTASIWESNVVNARYGKVVASAGDYNGDGIGDVIISSIDTSSRGAVRTCQGTGINSGFPFTCIAPELLGDQNGGNFGVSATSGDVNGDGYSEILVGSSLFDNPGVVNGGRIALYYGNGEDGTVGRALGLQARRPATGRAIPPGGRSGTSSGFDVAMVAAAGPMGRARVKLQVEFKPLGTNFDGTNLSTSPAWIDTGAPYTAIVRSLSVSGGTPHYRARLIYDPAQSPVYHRSRWVYGGRLGEPGAVHVRVTP